jgi:hypothetical protein
MGVSRWVNAQRPEGTRSRVTHHRGMLAPCVVGAKKQRAGVAGVTTLSPCILSDEDDLIEGCVSGFVSSELFGVVVRGLLRGSSTKKR